MSFLIVGIVAMAVLFQLLLGVSGLLSGPAIGVRAYFLAEKVVGPGR